MPSSDEPRSRRPLVDGGAARGGAQQELPTRGGGGATGDTGDRRGTGAAARAGPQLPALAPRCRSRRTRPRHGPQNHGSHVRSPVRPFLRDSCSLRPSSSRRPGGCPSQRGSRMVPGVSGSPRRAPVPPLCFPALGPSAAPCWGPLPRAGCWEHSPPLAARPRAFATRFCTRFLRLFI